MAEENEPAGFAGFPIRLRPVALGAGFRAFGLSLIGPFIALYLHNVLGIGYVEVGIVISAVSVPPLFLGGLGGFLADRVGRRRLYLVALLLEGSALGGGGFAMAAHSFVGVVAAGSLSGVGGSLAGPALTAYVSDFAEGPTRTRAFTWLRVGWNVGFALGTAVGGILLVFFGFAPVAWAASVSTLIGAAYLALTLAASPYDVRLAKLAEAGTPVGVAVPGVRPGTVGESLRMLRRDTAFLLFCLAFALADVTTSQWNVTFALFVSGPLHLPYSYLGLGFAVNGLVVVFGQVPTTELAIGRRHTTLAVAGVVAYVLAFLALGLDAFDPVAVVAVFFGAVVLLTIGENLTSIPFNTLPSNLAPATEVGAYNGVFGTIGGVGALLATVVGGVALATIHNPLLLWMVLCAPALPAILLFLRAGGRLPTRSNRA
ncbi:MAG TPA: MFS transporter [Thermoplasmata archaeon]|nr:MFS transporter [Thermoplasmata archaeon]